MKPTKLDNKTFLKYITPGVEFSYAEIIAKLHKDDLYTSEDSMNTRMRIKCKHNPPLAVKNTTARPAKWIISQESMDYMSKKPRQAKQHARRRKEIPTVSGKSDKLWSKVQSMPIV